ncbi:MAG: class I SAM-dependent methyltransferase [Thermoanaerobaculia bacterium]
MTTEPSWLTKLRRRWRRATAPPARSLPGVIGRVHVNDSMLYDESEQAVADYLRAGRSALDNIEKALRSSAKTFAEVETCLDFGCGYGRVLRQLQEQIPAAKITASDAVEEGVRFCAEEFGARPLVSSWNVDEIRLGIYDLIWSGSVFTHLDEASCETLFGKLGHSLMPSGGVLVFSIHGQYSLDGLATFYGKAYAEEADQICREVADAGICFRRYTDESYGRFPVPYGMTWHRPDYFERLAAERFGDRLQLTMWEAHGWDLHHDVLAFQRTH